MKKTVGRSTRLALGLSVVVSLLPSGVLAEEPAPTIRTVAGWLPQDMPAREVSLQPEGLDFDAAGNLYIADASSDLIWKVTPDGLASVIAGDGRACTNRECPPADGVPALGAHLGPVGDLAVGPDGDLYVSLTWDSVVSKVDVQTGLIEVVAGTGYPDSTKRSFEKGPADEVPVAQPHGLAFDSKGNLYISDILHFVGDPPEIFYGVLHRVNPDGELTNVALHTNYGVKPGWWPAMAVAVGPGDAIYWAGRLTVSRVDPSTGKVTLVAGLPHNMAQLGPDEGEGGPAYAAPFVRRIGGMEFGPDGSLYVADWGANRIRRIAAPVGPTSLVTHVAGCSCSPGDDSGGGEPTIQIYPPWPVGSAAGTRLARGYSGDGGDARKAELGLATGEFNDHPGSFSPSGIKDIGLAFSPSGDLFVADAGNNRVRAIDGDDGTIRTVAGNGGGGEGPLYFWFPGAFQPLRTGGGSSGDDGPGSRAQLASPSDVAADREGNVYVLDRDANVVRRIGADGTITTVAGRQRCLPSYACRPGAAPLGDWGPATSASFFEPSYIALDSSGTQLAISDTGHYRVRQVNLGPTPVTVYPGSSAPVVIPPGYIATVYGGGSCQIPAACSEGPEATSVKPVHGTFQGVAFDHLGNLYVAQTGQPWHRVRMADVRTGIVTTVVGGRPPMPILGNDNVTGCGTRPDDGLPGLVQLICQPTSIAVGPGSGSPSGALYVSEAGDSLVRKVDLTDPLRRSTVVAGTGTVGMDPEGPGNEVSLAYPHGLAVGPDGSVYIADTGNGRIRRLRPDGWLDTVAGVGGPPDVDPYNPGSRDLGGCGDLGDGGPAVQAGLCAPLGVAVGVDGTLFIADQLNHRIRAISGL